MVNPPDVEWLALELGLKPGLRQTLGREHVAPLERRVARAGFALRMGAVPVSFSGRAPELIAYVARTPALAEALRDAEAAILPGASGLAPTPEVLAAHASFGEALGFPRCCIDAFLARLARGVTVRQGGGFAHEDFVAVEDALLATSKALGRLNHLLFERRVRFISHYPCRYDCTASASYALRAFELTKVRAPGDADAMAAMLSAPIAVRPDGGRCEPAGAPEDALVVAFQGF